MNKGLKNKGAQVTIFIIIAMLLVGGIAAYFLIREKNNSQSESIPAEIKPVYDFVRGCIEEAGYQGVNMLGPLGGYATFIDGLPVNDKTYYSLNNFSIVPPKLYLELTISEYIKIKIDSCLNMSINHSEIIKKEETKINTNISGDTIYINAEIPLSIQKKDRVFKLKNFGQIPLKTRFGLLHQIAVNITNDYLDSGGFSLSYSTDIQEKYGIREVIEYYPNYTLIKLIDNKGIQDKFPLNFEFALS